MLGGRLHGAVHWRLGVHHALPLAIGLDPERTIVHNLFRAMCLVAARRYGLLHALCQDAHGMGRKLRCMSLNSKAVPTIGPSYAILP